MNQRLVDFLISERGFIMLLNEYDENKKAIINPFPINGEIKDFPKLAISCFSKEIIDNLVEKENLEIITIQKGENGDKEIYKIHYNNHDVAIYLSPVGAPACTVFYEEMIAYGVERLLLFGCAGVLDSSIEDYGIILPTSAVRDEGVSYHYLKAADEIILNPELVNKMETIFNDKKIKYAKGKVWTTDALYRETEAKLADRKSRGCIAVEMECASMASVAEFREKDFIQFLYAADNLDAEEWDCRSLTNSELSKKESLIYLALDIITNL